jgi:hypothetical protein
MTVGSVALSSLAMLLAAAEKIQTFHLISGGRFGCGRLTGQFVLLQVLQVLEVVARWLWILTDALSFDA